MAIVITPESVRISMLSVGSRFQTDQHTIVCHLLDILGVLLRTAPGHPTAYNLNGNSWVWVRFTYWKDNRIQYNPVRVNAIADLSARYSSGTCRFLNASSVLSVRLAALPVDFCSIDFQISYFLHQPTDQSNNMYFTHRFYVEINLKLSRETQKRLGWMRIHF